MTALAVERCRHGAARGFLAVALSALAVVGGPALAADAEPYPARPLRIVVPIAAGTMPDVVARIVGTRLAEALGQPVLVENRAGASGNIGMELAAKAAPDGYTLFFAGVTQTIQPSIAGPRAIDPSRAFAAITKLVSQPMLIAAHPGFPADSLPDLIALARRAPGRFAYATGGIGSTGHLAAAMLSMRAGIELLHVPYPSANLVMKDVISGEVPLTVNVASAGVPYLRRGQVKGLAVTGGQRIATLPEIPTVAELGYPDYEISSWYGMLAPVGTPPEIVDRLHRELVAILRVPAVRSDLSAKGMEVVGNTPEQFAAELRADVARWGPIVKATGIVVE